MSLLVNEQVYFTATEVAHDVGVVRQTLWRWRQQGKIPKGHRYRDRQILFSGEERDCIRAFAHKLVQLEDCSEPDTEN